MLDRDFDSSFAPPAVSPVSSVLLVGDEYGLPELARRVPSAKVAAVVAANTRPQSHDTARNIAAQRRVPLLVQRSADDPGLLRAVRDIGVDALLCHSYAMRIGAPILDAVSERAFNVHMSLLPRHRGPNPIQWTIIHGDAEAGATVHQMTASFDAGAIIAQTRVPVVGTDTWITLRARVQAATRELLDGALPQLFDGTWTATPQSEAQALHNPRIARDGLRLDFGTMSDVEIANRIRAQVAPLAGAYVDTEHGREYLRTPLTVEDVHALRARHTRTSREVVRA